MIVIVLYASPPKPPRGKAWVKVEGMTDEFDAKSPGSKWRIADKNDSWNRTAAFDKRAIEATLIDSTTGNYAVTINPMWYSANDVFTKGSRTYYFAGGLFETAEMAVNGYFEIRVKPSDFPMGSGIFMNSRSYTDQPCGEKYKTELDICENMGYTGPGANTGWNNTMHINSHVKPTDENCVEQAYISTNGNLGKKFPTGTGNKFHTVATWWKTKDSCLFYLDDVYFQTIVPKRIFNIPMPVILVSETYTWGDNDANNAGNPKPEADMFQDNFRTKAQRAVTFDYLRTWKLVDVDGNAFNDTKNNIDFYSKPVTLPVNSPVNFSLVYSAKQNCFAKIVIKNENGTVMGETVQPLETGVQLFDAKVIPASVLPIANYIAECILYTSVNGVETVLAKSVVNISSDKLVYSDSVFESELPAVLAIGLKQTVAIAYSASAEREIYVEMRHPAGYYMGATTVKVPKGVGTAIVPLTLLFPTTAGKDYSLLVQIRPVGGNTYNAINSLTALRDVASTVGVNRVVSAEPGLRVFPNPVSKSFQLGLSNNATIAHCRVTGITGQIMYDFGAMESGNSIDVSHLEKGWYLVYVRTEGGQFVTRFQKL